jgi:hypothetical protein
VSRPGQHLVHFNWATLRGDPGGAEVAGFEHAVPKVNTLAESSAGFVWRHGDERAAACAIGWPLFTEDPRRIASFSVWENSECLADYVYATVHGAFLRRSEAWFAPGTGVNYALWWIPQGQIPTMAEARERVERLLDEGPSEAVFDFEYLGRVV